MNTKPLTVVITGALNGIGRVVSKTLLSNGMNVTIADIAIPTDLSTLSENPFEDFNENQYRLVHCDVSKEKDVQDMIETTVNSFGHLHAVVNNAAFSNPYHSGKDITELSLEEWNKVVSVNLTSIFLTTKYAVPHLRKSKGCIINIASTRALQSEPNSEIYAATKGGVVSLTHSLAISLGPEINVNSVAPGWIDVRREQLNLKGPVSELRDIDREQHPVGRVGTGEDISKFILYLINDGCQENGGFITGQNFVIDGGMTKKMIYEKGAPWEE
ncbi:hypothetical protein ABK040_007834 [Willaertia magna]